MSHHQPSIVQTIDKIKGACPGLVYLEIVPCEEYLYVDKEYMRETHYTQWPWIEALRTLHVKVFTFCQPVGQLVHRNRSLYEKKWKQEQEIEEYVNRRTGSSVSGFGGR